MEKAAAAILSRLTGAWVVVLVPIFAFFFLKDGEHVVSTVERLIASARWRRLWRETVRDVHQLLGQYVRALIFLCCITFVVWTTVFLIGGVPYAVPLAALGGALEFIPVVGRGVELHPALVIFGVLAGGEIAGVAGMFLSVPSWRRRE